MDLSLLQQLGVALLLGSLVGLERERRYQLRASAPRAVAGLRTFALVGLIGALAYQISQAFIVFTAGFLFLMTVAYFIVARQGKVVGLTTEMALILVYMAGVLSAMESYVLATVIALTVTALLHFKDPLHKWAKLIKEKELISTLQFAIIAFVILPLLPNQGFGYEEFFNPRIIWLMMVFISGLSFVSYLAIKFFGARRGIVATGFLGGLVSSTALTLSFSEESRRNKKVCNPYVVAVVVAGSAMFFRVLVEVAVVNRDLLPNILVPMLAMGLTGAIASAYLMFFKRERIVTTNDEVLSNIESPFNFVPALKFGAFFALILFVSKFALSIYGDEGLYVVSLLSGILDVDAITLFVAEQAKTSLSDETATIAITLAAMTNTLSKGVMFVLFGRRFVGVRVLGVFLLMLLAGGASLLYL